MFYHFDSTGYLNTIGVAPVDWLNAIESGQLNTGIIERLIYGDYSPNFHFPIEFVVEDGRKVRDVIEMRSICAFLISNRIKALFETNKLTGWQPYDVIIKKKDGSLLPGFCGFSVIGRRPDRSHRENVPDFFRPDSSMLGIVCSQRVVDILKANKIKDFTYELICEDDYVHIYNKINYLL